MTIRRLKIYEAHRSTTYNRVPELRLTGKWLEHSGFNIGDHVDLLVFKDQEIIIRTSKYDQMNYSYLSLHKLLSEDSNPREIGTQFDEIMNALISHASHCDIYHASLEDHYNLLRKFRDIFWKLIKDNVCDDFLRRQGEILIK